MHANDAISLCVAIQLYTCYCKNDHVHITTLYSRYHDSMQWGLMFTNIFSDFVTRFEYHLLYTVVWIAYIESDKSLKILVNSVSTTDSQCKVIFFPLLCNFTSEGYTQG